MSFKLNKSGEKKIADALNKKGLRIEREAKQRCPVDSGRLRSSITTELFERGDKPVVRVGTNVEYAPFVEFGTDPHIIRPDDAEALKWTDSETGETVFAKEVLHPGGEAQPFLRSAARAVLNRGVTKADFNF